MTDTIDRTEPNPPAPADAAPADSAPGDGAPDALGPAGSGTPQGATAAVLLRISIRGAHRKADLAVPGMLPVADLLPDLADEVGLLDPATVHAGYRLVRGDGAVLRPEETLSTQGVVDGDSLLVVAGIDDAAPPVYDDVVEAVAATVAATWRAWDAASARLTALITSAALLGVAAVALGLAREDGVPVYSAGYAAAVLLVVAGAVLAHTRSEDLVATAVVWLAAPFAAAAGLAVVEDDPVLRLPMALAGAGVLAVGLAGLAALPRTRSALLPVVVLGLGAAASGGVLAAVDDARPGVPVAVVLVIAVIAGVLLPSFAASAAGLRAPQPQTTNDLTGEVDPPAPEDVARRVRIGRELLLALSATVALVVVAATPVVVDLGVGGALLAGAAAVALLLRTRSFHTYGEVIVGVVGGVGGLIALVISAIVLHPDWRPAMAGVGLAAAGLVFLVTLRPGGAPLRLRRVADVTESGALLSLLPLLAVAAGLFDAVQK